MSSVPLSGRSHEISARWAWHLGVLGALVCLILVTFRYETLSAVEVWWVYDTYSHCFLIIPISAWLVWQMRHELKTMSPTICRSAVLAIPPLLFFWLLGKLATINEVREFAVVGFIQVAILLTLGAQVYRAIWFPAIYLFFLVPVGQYFIPPMQDFATWFTDLGLTLLNVPHYTEGTLIELSTGRFEIAEACAGLRFMIATVTLGVLFAHLAYSKWYKIALFLAASIAIPLIANGLRCVGIIMLAYLTNNQVAVGVDHLIYGWIFNVTILLILFSLGIQFRDGPVPPRSHAGETAHTVPRFILVLFATAAALAIYLGPAYASWRDSVPVVINARPLTDLLTLNNWSASETARAWKPIHSGADSEFIARLDSGTPHSPPVDLAIEYYGRMREGRSIIATTNRLWDPSEWRQVGVARVKARVGNVGLELTERVIWSLSEKRLIWSTYWADGRFTTSATTVKLLQLKTAFVGNPAAALLALSTPVDGSIEDARLRLQAAFDGITDLPDRLVEAGQPQASRTRMN